MRILALLVLAPAVAFAAPSLVLQHTGRLVDGDDKPVTVQVELKFQLHTSATKNAQDHVVWEDTFNVQPNAAGVYSILLGDTSVDGHPALDGSDFTDDRWLSVAVAGEVLNPWLQVGAVPFATNAATVGGIAVAAAPTANALLALDASKKFPAAVLPVAAVDADGILAKADYAAFQAKLDKVAIGTGLTGDGTAAHPLSATLQGVSVGSGLDGDGTPTHPLTVTQTGFSGIAVDAPLAGNGTSSSHLALALQTGDGLTGAGTAASALKVTFAGTGSALTAARSDHTHTGMVTADSTGNATLNGSLRAANVGLTPTSGFTGGACTSQAGTILFDSTQKLFWACDGTSWSPFAGGTQFGTASQPAPTCFAIKQRFPTAATGPYTLQPDPSAPAFTAWCEMQTAGGGWTLVLRDRLNDGSLVASTQAAWLTTTSGTATSDADYLLAAGSLTSLGKSAATFNYLVTASGTNSIVGQYITCTQGEPITKQGAPANGACTYQDGSTQTSMTKGISFHNSSCKNVSFWADSLSDGTWWQGSLFCETPTCGCNGGWASTFPNALGAGAFGGGVVRTANYTTWIYSR